MLDSHFMRLLEHGLRVADSGWYRDDRIVQGFSTGEALLSSHIDYFAPQRACLENLMAKLVSPCGDPNWDGGWTPQWGRECRQLVEDGVIGEDKGYFDFCNGVNPYRETADPSTDGILLGGVSEIRCVTIQRVYAKVEWLFRDVLDDKARFGRDTIARGSGHIEPLRRFLEYEEVDSEGYTFEAWREKRRQGSLQCVVAIPKSEDGELYVDMDIDEWNPFADVFALVAHQGQTTDHEALQRQSYFLSQDEVLNVLTWVKARYGQPGRPIRDFS